MIPHEFIIYSVCIYKYTSNASYEISYYCWIKILINLFILIWKLQISLSIKYSLFFFLQKKSIISSNVCYLLLEESHWPLRFYTMDSLYDEPSTVILFYIGFMFSKFKRHRIIKLTFFIWDWKDLKRDGYSILPALYCRSIFFFFFFNF